jgi:anti-sigma-K factor RskA
MQNELIGYLIGALDAAERQAVDELLASDAELRHQLELLRHCLLPLQCASQDCEIPPGLAARTCQRIRGTSGNRPPAV